MTVCISHISRCFLVLNGNMQDLTYSYVHMTRHDLLVLDTVETAEYMKGELSDDGRAPLIHMRKALT